MKNFKARRLMLAGLGLIFAVGCSSTVKKVEYNASSNPGDEAIQLEQDINAGFAPHYDVLDQADFDHSQSKLADAKRQIQNGDKDEKVLSTLGYGRAYLNKAKERAESLNERAKGILESRTAALSAGARRFPVTAASLKNHDDELRAEIDMLADGSTTSDRWSILQKGYLNVELRAIQETNLGAAKAKISDARKHGAEKYTPNMLSEAERDLKNGENAIAADRHGGYAQASIDRTNASADILLAVLHAATKRPEGIINEDAALDMVRKNRSIGELNEKLNQKSNLAEVQSQQINRQGVQLKRDGEALSLNKAIETARKQFSSNEADVYQQGDKLLIRLKAMKFVSGRSELPADSLPLLAKVKNIAEELKPSQITVEGHTDSIGTSEANMILSQNRAEAVAKYFSSNGIEAGKIVAIGFGFTKPLMTNKTILGRAQNRRVDVIIVPEKPSALSQNL